MKQENQPTCLLILGCGYVGTKLAQACLAQGIQVKATTRSADHANKLQNLGITPLINHNPAHLRAHDIADCDALLDSIPLAYDEHKKPFQGQCSWIKGLLIKLPKLQWTGYLSATSVYADSQGQWIDESSTNYSTSPRGAERLQAEQAWLNSGAPAEVFRLAGIYGNERNILSKLMAGNYKTVAWQPAHYSNRIHVDDIVAALMVAMHKPQANRLINLADDEPCSHLDYATNLAKTIGAPKPIILTPQEAEHQLHPAFLSFFRDNKRISNQKLRQQLLPELKYPSFYAAIHHLLKVYNLHS